MQPGKCFRRGSYLRCLSWCLSVSLTRIEMGVEGKFGQLSVGIPKGYKPAGVPVAGLRLRRESPGEDALVTVGSNGQEGSCLRGGPLCLGFFFKNRLRTPQLQPFEQPSGLSGPFSFLPHGLTVAYRLPSSLGEVRTSSSPLTPKTEAQNT